MPVRMAVTCCRTCTRSSRLCRSDLQGWWEAVDHEDRPVAIMRLGQAVTQCDTKISAENLAQAMISLVGNPSFLKASVTADAVLTFTSSGRS